MIKQIGKNTLALVLLMTIAETAMAQFEQGSWMLGGGLGFSRSETTVNKLTSSSSSFTATPQIGLFIVKRVAIGPSLSYTSTNYKPSTVAGSVTNSILTFSPFIRYYTNADLYLQVTYDNGSTNLQTDLSQGSTTQTSKVSGWSVMLGYPILFNDHIALEPQIGYQSLSNKTNPTTSGADGFFVRFAFQIYLSKNKQNAKDSK